MLGMDAEPGIYLRTLTDLFRAIEEARDNMDYSVSMSYLEVSCPPPRGPCLQRGCAPLECPLVFAASHLRAAEILGRCRAAVIRESALVFHRSFQASAFLSRPRFTTK